MLVQSGLQGAVGAALQKISPDTHPVELSLKPQQSFLQSLSACLGLGIPLSKNEFVETVLKAGAVSVNADAGSLSSKDFLALIYLVADIAASCESSPSRIFIFRRTDNLLQDQELLWDRLPDHLELCLRRPPHSKGQDLLSYLWDQGTGNRKWLFF